MTSDPGPKSRTGDLSRGHPLEARASKLAAAREYPKVWPTRTNILSIPPAQKPL